MRFDEFLAKHGQRLEVKKDAFLFRRGEPEESIFVLQDGILKATYLSDAGTEMIKSFVFPGAHR